MTSSLHFLQLVCFLSHEMGVVKEILHIFPHTIVKGYSFGICVPTITFRVNCQNTLISRSIKICNAYKIFEWKKTKMVNSFFSSLTKCLCIVFFCLINCFSIQYFHCYLLVCGYASYAFKIIMSVHSSLFREKIVFHS